MRQYARSRSTISKGASRISREIEKLEQRFAMAADCGCAAAVDPSTTPTEPEPAAIVAPPEAAAARSQDVRIAATVDTSRLSGLAGGAAAARRGWVTSSLTREISRNEPRQAVGRWREGAYVGGRTFRTPLALILPEDRGHPRPQATDGIRFRVGLDGEGRPNRITDLRIQFLATLHKADGTREGRVINFSDAALTGPVRDEFDFAPSLTLQPRGGTQTFQFNWRDSGGFNDHLFFVELKLTWNNRTKTFTASMKAESDEIEGQSLVARTYPGGQRGVVLASGPRRDPIYVDGVLLGYGSGAMRRTGA